MNKFLKLISDNSNKKVEPQPKESISSFINPFQSLI